MRTVGVEEELLVVDLATGQPRSMAGTVIGTVTDRLADSSDLDSDSSDAKGSEAESDDAGAIEGELQRTMVETQSSVATDLAVVRDELLAWRRRAGAAARAAGVAVAALATSPVAYEGQISRNDRYEKMAERFGLTAQEVLSCGCHVHVGVESDDEGIGALDRMRRWLPVILAVSANSPFVNGRDSGYASYRSQLWVRWPSAGPVDPFGSPAGYHELVNAMVDSGVLLDDGMVYFDARLSAKYPTVEVRVADVCTDVDDAVLVAALCRALVETCAAEWAAGDPVPQVSTSLLRLATWQAGREGVDGELLDPATFKPLPALDVVRQLTDYVCVALESAGDVELVEAGVERLARVGTGASVQRRTHARTQQLVDVVAEAARRTTGHG